MAISETTKSSYYRVRDAVNATWQRFSFWTKGSDVEFTDGKTAQTKVGAIDGITDSLASSSSRMAASAKAVKQLNDNIKVYVGSDGKLHFKNGAGTDTALNFSGGDVPVVAPDYNTAETYSKQDVVLYNGTTYICIADNVTGTWSSTYWQRVYLSDLTEYNSNLGGIYDTNIQQKTLTNMKVGKQYVVVIDMLYPSASFGNVIPNIISGATFNTLVYTTASNNNVVIGMLTPTDTTVEFTAGVYEGSNQIAYLMIIPI